MLMLREGTSEAQISDAMRRALSAAKKSTVDSETLTSLYVTLSAVLHAWHQDQEYIDTSARPVPLPLRGRKRSIEALAAKVGSRVPTEKLLSSLKVQRLVRYLGRGMYAPTSALAQLSGDGPEMSGYVGKAILHLIETNESNRRDRSKTRPLLERAAIVQDLPIKDAVEFKQFSSEQGANLVANASAWLESRRRRVGSKMKRGRTVTAGLHVFAFVAPASRKPKA